MKGCEDCAAKDEEIAYAQKETADWMRKARTNDGVLHSELVKQYVIGWAKTTEENVKLKAELAPLHELLAACKRWVHTHYASDADERYRDSYEQAIRAAVENCGEAEE